MPQTQTSAKKLPFSVYDFFGYLLPGFYFCLSLCLFAFYEGLIPSEASKIINGEYGNIFLVNSVVIVGFVLIIYFFGHVLSTLSHAIIDKIIVKRLVGYPSEKLFGIDRDKRDYSSASLKYVFVLVNLYVLIPFGMTLDPKGLELRFFLFDYYFFQKSLFISIFVLFLFRFFASYVNRKVKKDRILEIEEKFAKVNYLIRIVFLGPVKFLDNIYYYFDQLFGMNSVFNEEMKENIKSKYSKLFGTSPDFSTSDPFWILYLRQVNDSNYHAALFRNWLNLFGFARNITTASFVVAIFLSFYCINFSCPNIVFVKIHIGFTVFIGWIFGLRYYLIYTSYYTKNVYRSFLSLSQDDTLQVAE